MDVPRPMPVLSYTGDDRFGWREEDGEVHLLLPHASNWTPLIEHGAGLLSATVFTICALFLVVFANRSLPSGQGIESRIAIAVGLLVIGIWAGVVVRCIRVAQTGTRQTVVVCITSIELEIGPPYMVWYRESIMDVKLVFVKPNLFRPARARLEVQFVDGTRDGVWLPWPQGEPVESHEQRLRELLNLKPMPALA